MELTYQKSCLGNNDTRKENIFDMKFSLHNKLMRKCRNICSYCYLMTSVKMSFVVVFVNQTGTEILIY